MSNLSADPQDGEPVTIVTSQVRRAVDQQELLRNRRAGDRLDAYARVIVPAVLTAMVGYLFWLRDITNANVIYITQLQATQTANVLNVKELQTQRQQLQSEQLEKLVTLTATAALVDRRLETVERRLDILQTSENKFQGRNK